MCARVFPHRNCIQPRNRQPDRIDRQVTAPQEITWTSRRVAAGVPQQISGPVFCLSKSQARREINPWNLVLR